MNQCCMEPRSWATGRSHGGEVIAARCVSQTVIDYRKQTLYESEQKGRRMALRLLTFVKRFDNAHPFGESTW